MTGKVSDSRIYNTGKWGSPYQCQEKNNADSWEK